MLGNLSLWNKISSTILMGLSLEMANLLQMKELSNIMEIPSLSILANEECHFKYVIVNNLNREWLPLEQISIFSNRVQGIIVYDLQYPY